ncbi:MAG: NUDIX hydrolase [Candidatus Eisenbacteria bacterium]
MRRKWTVVCSEARGRFPIFSVRVDRSVSPDTGYEKEWTILETNDWVNVIPVTPEGRIVLIRQFRAGTGSYTIEIPGGGVDRGDRSAEEAAGRELREETGYLAAGFTRIGTVEPNPAFQTNRCHTYLARDVVPDGAQNLEPGEEIEVFEADENEVRRMLREGEIAHALVVAAFFWYELHRRRQGGVDAPSARE